MVDGEKSFTAGGNIRAASLPEVCRFVKESLEEIDTDMIKRLFKKCRISNVMDGTEDDILREENEIRKLFDSDKEDSDEEFIGSREMRKMKVMMNKVSWTLCCNSFVYQGSTQRKINIVESTSQHNYDPGCSFGNGIEVVSQSQH